MHAPTSAQLKDAIYVLRYLKGTIEMGITFRQQPGRRAVLLLSYYHRAMLLLPGQGRRAMLLLPPGLSYCLHVRKPLRWS